MTYLRKLRTGVLSFASQHLSILHLNMQTKHSVRCMLKVNCTNQTQSIQRHRNDWNKPHFNCHLRFLCKDCLWASLIRNERYIWLSQFHGKVYVVCWQKDGISFEPIQSRECGSFLPSAIHIATQANGDFFVFNGCFAQKYDTKKKSSFKSLRLNILRYSLFIF